MSATPEAPAPALLRLTTASLRGVGQVMFQNSAWAGLLFLAGIAAHAPWLAAATLLGAVAATLTAGALPIDRKGWDAGLYGFNGALTTLALVHFLGTAPQVWVVGLVGAMTTSLLVVALERPFARWRLPILTAPFVGVTLLLLALTGPPVAVSLAPITMDAAALGAGVLRGIGQIFFQGQLISGGVFLVALLVINRRCGALALSGALGGLAVAVIGGADSAAATAGLYGFNSALTAIALGAVVPLTGRGAGFVALLASLGAALLTMAVARVLAPLGLPGMTLPFVLATWGGVLLARRLPA